MTLLDHLRSMWCVRPSLVAFTLLMALLAIFFAVGIAADERVIAGQPAWLKPTKFALSISIYTATIAWLLSLVRAERPRARRVLDLIAWTVLIALALEIAVITTQVLRGTTSHFNVATPLDLTLWSTMGIAIIATWAVGLLLAVFLFAQPLEPPAIAWSIRLGLVISLVGMAQGFLMISPTPDQLALWEAGGRMTIVGAHTVGASDLGPGLPVTGWRTDTGDLRVGHFVGLHALQVLPLVGWFVSRRRRLHATNALRLVWTAAASYLAFVLLLTWQALRGQALLDPDVATLAALLAIVVGTAGAVLLIVHPVSPLAAVDRRWEGAPP
jgi:hypothetical protein